MRGMGGALRDQFSAFILWVPGIESRSSGLAEVALSTALFGWFEWLILIVPTIDRNELPV